MENPLNNSIETRALTFGYGRHSVLKNINLQVPAKSIFGFLGPNGAGKSTTIKTLLGLLHIENGMVHIFGKELNANKMYILKRIGAMVESPSLYEHLDAIGNLHYTARLRNLPFNSIPSLLDTVSLTQDANRPIKQYSTGMKQRLSLAIALLAEPELLILDEPINGLDPNGIIEIRQLLVRINQEKGCTILLSSHILGEIEKLCSDVAIINTGSLVYQGNIQNLLNAATGNENLTIHTNDAEKAKIALGDRFDPSIRNEALNVTVSSKQQTASIIKLLVEKGIDIYSIKRETSGLETSFLHLLNENHPS